MTQYYKKLDDLFCKKGSRGYVVGELMEGKDKDGKKFTYFRYFNYRHYIDFFSKIFGKENLSGYKKPKLNLHEVVHQYLPRRKVVFDIDIEDGGDDLYHAVLDDLIGALCSIFPDLDLSKEIVDCTSHASAVKYSAHVVLLRFIMNTEESKDLKHLYDLITSPVFTLTTSSS